MRLINRLNEVDQRLVKNQKTSFDLLIGSQHNKHTIHRYFHPFLCYCQKCIEMGYHSWVHQSIFAKECPIHHIPLQRTCPKCNQPILLDLGISKNNHAYSCLCGYTFMKEDSLSSILSNWSSQDIVSQILSCNYEQLSLTSKKLISLYYYSNLGLGDRKCTYIPLDDEESVAIAEVAIAYYGLPKLKLSEKDRLIKLLLIYNGILKGLAKHLRKMTPKMTYRIKHLRQVITYNLTIETVASDEDIEAFVYLMWRRDIEGHTSYKTVHANMESSNCASGLGNCNNYICNSTLFQYF